ncbi:MAG: hypothetical protein WC796_02850 [Candidatus Pacearchaeota archaeon]|jgi:hypothetical protein
MIFDKITGFATNALGLDYGTTGLDPLSSGSLIGSSNPFSSYMSLLGGAILAFLVIAIIIGILLYFYISFAFMRIGYKAGLACPGVSWISPIVSIFEISKMHWWPWPVLIVGGPLIYFLTILLAMVSPILMIFTGILAVLLAIMFPVMVIIWNWKTFEAVGRPGWWAIISPILIVVGILLMFLLLSISPFVGILLGGIIILVGVIIYLVLIGIAAWGNVEGFPQQEQMQQQVQ